MFSESISKLMGSGGMQQAEERAAKLDSMVAQFNTSIQDIKPPSTPVVKAPTFSELLKVQPEQELKFKVVPPDNISKGSIENIVKDISAKYNIDHRLVLSIIKQESGFNPNAISSAGAQGLMQLMPTTAKGLGVKNSFDPVQNVEGGVKFLKRLLDKYNGNLVLALAAYNSGTGNVNKYGGVPPFKETQNYVKKILSNYLG